MDLHERFNHWLADGAEGDPARDLALHAWSCDACMRAVAAMEALQAIDVGAAELPPLRAASGRPRPFAVARVAVGAAAVVLLGVSVAVGGSGLFDRTPAATEPTASPAEGVLAGEPASEQADPTASPTPSPSATPTPSASASAVAAPEPTAAPVQLALPTPAPQPPPPPPTAAPATPSPSATPTAAPTSTPPTPSPEPTPTPVLDDCEDGVDNDGDTLIDILDPGCLTGNEVDA